MAEKIQAHAPGGKKATEIEVVIRTPLSGNGTEPKTRVEGMVEGRPISLIERRSPTNEAFKTNWEKFRKAGLPVIPTLRVDRERGHLLVTDLKRDGSELYGKNLKFILLNEGKVKAAHRRHSDVDKHFLELSAPESFELIKKKAEECARQATEHRLSLPMDDPLELLIHPDGRWDLIILDLTWAADRSTSSLTQQQLQGANELLVGKFIESLQEIRRMLLEKRSTQ